MPEERTKLREIHRQAYREYMEWQANMIEEAFVKAFTDHEIFSESVIYGVKGN